MSLYMDLAASIFAVKKEEKHSGKICRGERMGLCLHLVFNFLAFEMSIMRFSLYQVCRGMDKLSHG